MTSKYQFKTTVIESIYVVIKKDSVLLLKKLKHIV